MKNLKGCRTEFGMTGKLAAVVLGTMLMAFPFASCNTNVRGDAPNDTPNSYTVTIATDIENGTVTASPVSEAAGETITLTVTPDSGYELNTLTVKDASNADVTTTEVPEGESYTFTMPKSNVTVTATFKLSYEIKSSEEEKVVGDIVLNDGRAIAYREGLSLTAEHRDAAIAIIFYKGTELNSGSDTASRTLGVGLKLKTGLAWCLNSAAANSKNITTIKCPASGYAGALTFIGDKNGSDNLKQISDFLVAADGVDDDTAIAANYPAFYFAEKYSDTATNIAGTDYEGGWYLPSIAELFQIWKSKATVDAASALCGGNQFGSSYYWSSSQYASNDDNAYVLLFGYGAWDHFYKDDVYSVCAVRAFN